MTMQDTEHIDKHTEHSLERMKECQASKSINSCFKCKEQMLVCDIRKQYVKDVYKLMNPNFDKDTNGFNF